MQNQILVLSIKYGDAINTTIFGGNIWHFWHRSDAYPRFSSFVDSMLINLAREDNISSDKFPSLMPHFSRSRESKDSSAKSAKTVTKVFRNDLYDCDYEARNRENTSDHKVPALVLFLCDRGRPRTYIQQAPEGIKRHPKLIFTH
jgi:hypothetical protein